MKGQLPVASERVRAEWARRVEAEYGSAAIAQHLGLWLLQIGASPDLVRASQRAARDELVHAAQARRVHLAAGGDGVVTLRRESLGLTRSGEDPLEVDVARVCVAVFCLGETVAVPLFAAMRASCTVKPARVALDRVLRDEVRHRDLGWTLLTWLLDLPQGPTLRGTIVAELPGFFARLRRSYGASDSSDEDTIDAADRAWGLMASARYEAVMERSIAKDHTPRFARLGIDAVRAWAAARKLG